MRDESRRAFWDSAIRKIQLFDSEPGSQWVRPLQEMATGGFLLKLRPWATCTDSRPDWGARCGHRCASSTWGPRGLPRPPRTLRRPPAPRDESGAGAIFGALRLLPPPFPALDLPRVRVARTRNDACERFTPGRCTSSSLTRPYRHGNHSCRASSD